VLAQANVEMQAMRRREDDDSESERAGSDDTPPPPPPAFDEDRMRDILRHEPAPVPAGLEPLVPRASGERDVVVDLSQLTRLPSDLGVVLDGALAAQERGQRAVERNLAPQRVEAAVRMDSSADLIGRLDAELPAAMQRMDRVDEQGEADD
jgi:hypothetical protein